MNTRIRIYARPGARLYLTNLDGAGVANPAGYELNPLAGMFHEAIVPDPLSGYWYAEAKPTEDGPSYGEGEIFDLEDTDDVFVVNRVPHLETEYEAH